MDEGTQVGQALLRAGGDVARSMLATARPGAVERLLGDVDRGKRGLVVRVRLGDRPEMSLALASARTGRERTFRRINVSVRLTAFENSVLQACMAAMRYFRRHATPPVLRAFDHALLGGADVCIDVRIDTLRPALRCYVQGSSGREAELFAITFDEDRLALH